MRSLDEAIPNDALQFIKPLITLSQCPDIRFRQQAQQELQNLTKINIHRILELTEKIVYYSIQQSSEYLMGISWPHIAILTLSFLKSLFLCQKTKFPFPLYQMLERIYLNIYGKNQKVQEQVSSCLIEYLNGPSNLRIKRQYIKELILYLISKLNLISKILSGPRQQVSLKISVGSHLMYLQILIKQKWNHPPPMVSKKIWYKIILGLINFSGIPPTTQFYITGILSEFENMNYEDIDLYINFLKLYRNGSYGRINSNNIFQYDVQILMNIINKVSFGLLNKIAQYNLGISAIQQLLFALCKSFCQIIDQCVQNTQARQSQYGVEILNQQFFMNLCILVTSILNYTQLFEQEALICNNNIILPVSKVIEKMLQINEQLNIEWVSKFLQYSSFHQDTQARKSVLIFFSLMPRRVLQQLLTTQYLFSEFVKHQALIQEVLQNQKMHKNLQLTLCFLGFLQHYIDTYEYLSHPQILQRIESFISAILLFNLENLKSSQVIDKFCIMKTFAINIQSKLQKFFQKDETNMKQFFQKIVFITADTLKHYDNAHLKNSSIILEKIKQGILCLIKINRYRPILFQQSIEFEFKLISELFIHQQEPYKQKINYLLIQMINLTCKTLQCSHLSQPIIILFSKSFHEIVESDLIISLEEHFLQLYEKMLYEINLNIIEDKINCSGIEEQIPDNQRLYNFLITLENQTKMINYIINSERLLNADSNTLIIYVRIILEMVLYPQFQELITMKLLEVYQIGKNNSEFREIFNATDLIWEAIIIIYGWNSCIDQFSDMEFYERINKIREWDLEKILCKLDIDPDQKKSYQEESLKNASNFKYKWSKLPQVKKVVYFGSIVNTVVDKKLGELFS